MLNRCSKKGRVPKPSKRSESSSERLGREKWLHEVMEEMEDSLKQNRQGEFFRKLRNLDASRAKPTSTILDESGQPIKSKEEKLARWRRHFEVVLNVQNTVAEEVIAGVEDLSTADRAEVTREEVEHTVNKLKNSKAAGSDEIAAEVVKDGGQAMIEWLWELLREVWKTKQVPQEWKNATLIPLHKKKDRKVCDDHQGIAMLIIPGKVLTCGTCPIAAIWLPHALIFTFVFLLVSPASFVESEQD